MDQSKYMKPTLCIVKYKLCFSWFCSRIKVTRISELEETAVTKQAS
jgi:hypothetical protein